MSLNMIEKYDKYWENTHGFLGVAAVLDPRLKMPLIKYYYSSIYEECDDEMIESIMRRFDLLTIYECKNKKDGVSAIKPPASTNTTVVIPNRNRLHPKTLKALMCTQSWLAALDNGGEATIPKNPFPTINDDDKDVEECVSGVTYVDS
ncbi:hypothetical protein RHMOL_Rhmol10G0214600 [Rhododendron molle]|uniref:Uncharacterized protein n=1 Tax=Rhododendron molle TaxID=49168 RepID=A0ACC0M4G4_RHOML|nr:hypothetical protein RHMOL_Rhmol10G0214600 [Rhododendron molle]